MFIEQVPEVAEKVVKRENIKELIMEKERHIKELSAVSVDESVIKVSLILICGIVFPHSLNATAFYTSYDLSSQHYLLIRCKLMGQYPMKILE